MQRVRLRTLIDRRSLRSPYCYWCDVTLDSDAVLSRKTVDHYIPKAQGGPDTVANLVPSCGFCNWTRDQINADVFEQVASEIIRPHRDDMQTVIDRLNQRDHTMANRAYGSLLTVLDIVPRNLQIADLPRVEFDDPLPQVRARRGIALKWAAAADNAGMLIHKNKGRGISIGHGILVHAQMLRTLHIPGGFSVLSISELRMLKRRNAPEPHNARFYTERTGSIRWKTFSMGEAVVGVVHYETDVAKADRVQKVWLFADRPASLRSIMRVIEQNDLVSLQQYRAEQFDALWDWDMAENHA